MFITADIPTAEEKFLSSNAIRQDANVCPPSKLVAFFTTSRPRMVSSDYRLFGGFAVSYFDADRNNPISVSNARNMSLATEIFSEMRNLDEAEYSILYSAFKDSVKRVPTRKNRL